jgi:hypothetical protein
MNEINRLVEEEVQRRVNDTLAPLIEYISVTYDISLQQVMRDLASIKTIEVTTCLGVSAKTKKRCKNKAKTDGYCHVHLHQAPRQSSPKHVTQKHTHTLPPFFMKGCPVCDKSKSFRDLADCFENE